MKVNKLILIILGFFANFPVELVGVIKLSELFCILLFILKIKDIILEFRTNNNFKIISICFFIWLFVGFVSSIVNEIPETAFLKGIANVVIFYVAFCVFYFLINSNFSNIPTLLLFYGLGSIFFSPYSYSLENEMSLSKGLELEGYDNFFDVYIVPVVTPILMAFSIVYYKNPKIVIGVIFAYGLVAVVNEAKSIGLIFIMVSSIAYLKNLGLKLSLRKIRIFIAIGIFMALPILTFFVKNNIFGEHSTELLSSNIENTARFNPFVLIGRLDPMIGLIAFADQPILGHGFNKDESKYTDLAILLGFVPSDYYTKYDGIPSHSNLIETMVEIGILGSLIWLFFLRINLFSFSTMFNLSYNKYSILIIILFFYNFWSILFSGIVRIELSIFLTVMLIFIKNHKFIINGQ